ncbi:MAG: hypothetical protein Q9169_000419 [Polycauliona sp. 2 TL-2023]
MARSQKKQSVQKTGGKVLQKPHLPGLNTPSSPSGTSTRSTQPKNDGMSPTPSDHGDPEKLDLRPTKRLKSNTGSAISSTSGTTPANTHKLPAPSVETIQMDPASSLPSIPAEVQHLQSQYDISTMSIISSSKVNQKVKSLIDRVEKFTFANLSAKPGVVALHAKAACASKLISVVEIAKKDIEKRGNKWYQYTKAHSELLEFKEKQSKQPRNGRTLTDETSSTTADGRTGPYRTDVGDKENLGSDHGDDSDGQEAFETLQHQSGDATTNGRSMVRTTPILTIYFACVPVPGLKDLFGEQTQSQPR